MDLASTSSDLWAGDALIKSPSFSSLSSSRDEAAAGSSAARSSGEALHTPKATACEPCKVNRKMEKAKKARDDFDQEEIEEMHSFETEPSLTIHEQRT